MIIPVFTDAHSYVLSGADNVCQPANVRNVLSYVMLLYLSTIINVVILTKMELMPTFSSELWHSASVSDTILTDLSQGSN